MSAAFGSFGAECRVRQPPSGTARTLLVLLHGVGGHPSNLAGLAAAMPPDMLVLMPHGPITLGPGQHAWFEVAFTAQGPVIAEAQAEQSRQGLIQGLQQAQAHSGLAPAQTVIAGFSQGGILSASVGLSAPESVAGFGLLCGRILPELQPHMAEAPRLAGLQAFIGHGEYDSRLPVAWAQRSDALLTQLGVAHTTRIYPIDHTISAQMQQDFVDWLVRTVSVTE